MNNKEFLEALCIDLLDEGEVIATVTQTDKHKFPARAWKPGAEIPEYSTHWGSAVFLKSGEVGGFMSRQKPFVVGAVALVLDDVVEKGAGLEMDPWARIETKPGSEQWVYRFTEQASASDFAEMQATLNYTKGIADTEGNSTIRVTRLLDSQPIGKKHKARLLTVGGPSYHPFDILTVLGATLDPEGVRQAAQAATEGRNALIGTVDMLRGLDPVFDWLMDVGWIVEQPRSNRHVWWAIRCPWDCDHSSESDPFNTAYSPAKGGGAFHCFRGEGHVSEMAKLEGFRTETQLFREWVESEGGPRAPIQPWMNLEERLTREQAERMDVMAGRSTLKLKFMGDGM